jgi:hypothetical protein
MADGRSLEELLFQFFLSQYPALLSEEEVFDRLLQFVHTLLLRATRIERERQSSRVRSVSSC